MAPSSRDDAQLLASGEPADFEAFYLRHVEVVTAFVSRRVRHRENTVDAVAETFARALARRAQYRPARGPAIAWLLWIARNLLVDEARRGVIADRAQQRLGIERIAVSDADLEAVDDYVSASLDAALDRLPPDQRDAVRRRVLLDEPYGEIARRAGCSEQVVRQRVRRGLQALRTTAEDA